MSDPDDTEPENGVFIEPQEYTHVPAAPWKSPGCFPLKPTESRYGYMAGGKLYSCTRDELISCSSNAYRPNITLVWHPDSPRLEPLQEVPFLVGSLAQKYHKKLKISFVGHALASAGLGAGLLASVFVPALDGAFQLLLILFIAMGVVPTVQSGSQLRQLRGLPAYVLLSGAGYSRFVAWMDIQKTRVTHYIFFAISAVAIVQLYKGYLPSVGVAGIDKAEIADGEFWRILSGTLLHGNLVHFAFNAWALIFLGRITEALAGPAITASVMLFSAIGGALAFYYGPGDIPSVGFSGALTGLIGFLLILGKRSELLPPHFMKIIFRFVIFLTCIGILGWNVIDNFGHLGGAITGGIIAFLLVNRRQPSIPTPVPAAVDALGRASLSILIGFSVLTIVKLLEN